MTYRKTIEINDHLSLNEGEIVELLNALASQAAFASAWLTFDSIQLQNQNTPTDGYFVFIEDTGELDWVPETQMALELPL